MEENTLYKFNEDNYLTEGTNVYNIRSEIENIADTICKTGFDNIILTGVGGTTADLTVVEKFFDVYSNLDVKLINAADALVTKSKYITNRSLIITGSKSGDTKETVAICEYARNLGAQVVVFISNDNGPLNKIATYPIISNDTYIENALLKYYLLAGRIMYNKGYFLDYPDFANEMKYLSVDMLDCKKIFEPTADKLAKEYWNEPYQIWVASDINYGIAYLYTMCILEEMQWMRTKLVSSSDFFHGTLELVDKDVPVFLVKGVGNCRILDERVEKFLVNHTSKLYVFDLAEYPLNHISEKYRYLVSPILLASLTRGRHCEHLEKYSGHDLNFRRYYRQFEY